jgi:hypothetical protein
VIFGLLVNALVTKIQAIATDSESIASSLIRASEISDLVNQLRPSVNNVYEDIPVIEEVKEVRPTSSKFGIAILEVLFTRPAGPSISSNKDFLIIRMTNLDFLN